jgi:hypothetical protein
VICELWPVPRPLRLPVSSSGAGWDGAGVQQIADGTGEPALVTNDGLILLDL